MPFDHERLDVYQLALEFFDLADGIVNNIAEGAGKFSKLDKRRYYLVAMGSATESAAMLDVRFRRKLTTEDVHRHGKELLDRIVAMLVRLAKNLQD